MLGAIKAVPETIKSWRENREQLYNAAGCIAAALVLISMATGSRPLDSLAVLTRGIGIPTVADWLTVSAPPFVSAHVSIVNTVALSFAIILFIGMIAVPLLRGRHDDSQVFGYELLPLIGSPAAATIWVLLSVAAQHGDVTATITRWRDSATTIGIWALIALVFGGVLYLVASRCWLGDLIGALLRFLANIAYRLIFGLGFASFAVLLAAIALPLSIISWMTGLEADHGRKIRADIARERAEREPQPTGAVPLRMERSRDITPVGIAATPQQGTPLPVGRRGAGSGRRHG